MTASDSAAMAAGPGEPIAIIGMSCRLPGAAAPEALWQLLRDGTDAITEAPAGRWPQAVPGPYRRGGFVSDVEGFDADLARRQSVVTGGAGRRLDSGRTDLRL